MDCSTKTLFDCFSGINLTDDQKTAVDKLQLFFDDPDKKLFLLTGYAGTGKTTLLKGLYEYAASLQKSIHIMAPTGKAAHIIRTKAQCPAATIHSHIYEINLNPEARLESAGDEDGIPDVIQIARLAEGIPENLEAVYIVDESSMIGDNDADSYTDRRSKARHRESRIRFGSGRLLADLMKFCCVDKPQFSGKIIFIGDKAQLPPVFASSSPAFDKFYLKSEYHLDADSFGLEQVVRQDSRSGILSNAESIRRAIDSRTFNRLKIEPAADVELISHDEVLAKFVEGWRMKPVKHCR